MPSTRLFAAALAAGSAALVGALGGTGGGQSLAVYYGQGDNQPTLATFCSNTDIDVIPIGFIVKFPNTGKGGVIQTNFANRCNAPAAPGTDFFFDCPGLGEDIITCQNMGKKILLSLGGAMPAGSYYLDSYAAASTAADQIWSAFGPVDATWTYGRPFGDAVVDGFDFDLEQGASQSLNGQHYANFGTLLWNKIATDTSKTYYLSAAPQCIYPDAQLEPLLAQVPLDFIFVQFYNNPSCRPTNLLSTDSATQNDQMANFNDWNTGAVNNPHSSTKWYLGLLAQKTSPDFVSQGDLQTILQTVQPMSNFGGIMLWEATSASKIVNVNNVDYIKRAKLQLAGTPDLAAESNAPPPNPDFPTVSSTTAPGETHLFVDPTCNLWHLVQSGETCATIVTKANGLFTAAQLDEWNEQTRNGCSAMWAQTYICVGVAGSTPNTFPTISSTTAPGQTHLSVDSTCNLWYLVPAQSTCATIITAANGAVTRQQLNQWNEQTRGDCSSLWANTYLCVGVSQTSAFPTISSTTAPGDTHLTVTPLCNLWYYVNAGDTCAGIVTAGSGLFTQQQLEDWNEQARNGCSGMWANVYLCVGVVHTSSSSVFSIASSTHSASSVVSLSSAASQSSYVSSSAPAVVSASGHVSNSVESHPSGSASSPASASVSHSVSGNAHVPSGSPSGSGSIQPSSASHHAVVSHPSGSASDSSVPSNSAHPVIPSRSASVEPSHPVAPISNSISIHAVPTAAPSTFAHFPRISSSAFFFGNSSRPHPAPTTHHGGDGSPVVSSQVPDASHNGNGHPVVSASHDANGHPAVSASYADDVHGHAVSKPYATVSTGPIKPSPVPNKSKDVYYSAGQYYNSAGDICDKDGNPIPQSKSKDGYGQGYSIDKVYTTTETITWYDNGVAKTSCWTYTQEYAVPAKQTHAAKPSSAAAPVAPVGGDKYGAGQQQQQQAAPQSGSNAAADKPSNGAYANAQPAAPKNPDAVGGMYVPGSFQTLSFALGDKPAYTAAPVAGGRNGTKNGWTPVYSDDAARARVSVGGVVAVVVGLVAVVQVL